MCHEEANEKLKDMFGSCFLITVFENTDNTILVFSENCFYSLNLVFSVFSVFYKKKKKKKLETKRVLSVFYFFLFSLFFRTENSI